MEEAFDPFEDSVHSSESERSQSSKSEIIEELIDESYNNFYEEVQGEEDEEVEEVTVTEFNEDQDEEEVEVTVTGTHRSYIDVTLHDDDDFEETYHSDREISSSNRKNNGVSKKSILNMSNGGFSALDDIDEDYIDEILVEEVVEEIVEDDDQQQYSIPLKDRNETSSESERLSKNDLQYSGTESSAVYDADVDSGSQQFSSASSYSAAINDDTRRQRENSRRGPPRRIKTTEEIELNMSSTSLRSGSFQLTRATASIGDNSIRSNNQSHSMRKNSQTSPRRSGDMSSNISDSSSTMESKTGRRSSRAHSVEKSPRSKSHRMVSNHSTSIRSSRLSQSKNETIDHSTSIRLLKKISEVKSRDSESSPVSSRKTSSRRSKSQNMIPVDSTSIRSVKKSSEKQSRGSESSSASTGRTPAPDSRAVKETRRHQRRKKHRESMPVSPSSTTSSLSANKHLIVSDGRCPSIAVLGTMSGTGKSIIATALCRILANGGTKCAPFKSQNTGTRTSPALLPTLSHRDALYGYFAAMEEQHGSDENKTNDRVSSLSIAPSKEQGYGQIGMAQNMQAEACKIVPRVQMNPIFFKSSGTNEQDEITCAIIVMGKQIIRETHEYISKRIAWLKRMALDSHRSLAAVTGAEIIVIQGGGSCSELNTMDGDIVNLPLVRCLQCPWLLVANAENGGVFAQVVGTKMCVSKRDWALCIGVIINKVKSEIHEFVRDMKRLEKMAGKPLFAMPFVDELDSKKKEAIDIELRLAAEKNDFNESDHEYETNKRRKPSVVVVAYPHTTISNDLYPLEKDSRFHVEWRRKRLPKPYPKTTAVILPGSRLPLLDLKWLQDSGWDDFVRTHVSAGGTVLGLFSGYQMLGWNFKGGTDTKQGIGLLPISSTAKLAECNRIDPLEGQLYPSGIHVEGFVIDCGVSEVVSSEQKNVVEGRYEGISPLVAHENGKPEGMRLGQVKGTCIHGILRSAKVRVELLVPTQDRKQFRSIVAEDITEDPLDKLAKHLETSGLDYNRLRKMVFRESSTQ